MVFQELTTEFIIKNIKTMIFYLIIVLIIFPTQTILLPKLYGQLFDAKRSKSFFINSNIPMKTKNIIYIIFFLWALIIIGHSIKTGIEANVYPNFLSHIRKEIVQNTIHKYENNYKNLKVGAHTARIMEVSRNIAELFFRFLDAIFPIIIVCLFINIFYFYYDKTLGFISLAGLTTLFFVCYYFVPKIIAIAAKRENYYYNMSEKIMDSYNNLLNIYLNNDQKNTLESNSYLQAGYTKIYQSQIQLYKTTVLIFSIISLILFIAVIYYLYKMQKNGNITRPLFISLVLITIYYLNYLMQFSNQLAEVTTKIGNVENSREFLESLYKKKKQSIKNDNIKDGKLELKNINFKYSKDGKMILQNFNLKINGGEKIAIIGKSGSGKSTLMKIVMKLYKNYEGDVTIDGIDIKKISNAYLRNKVNYINQQTLLFNDSIINNIKKGNKVTDQQIKKMITKYQLESVFASLKDGINSSAGVNGNNLSLGMQKTTLLLRGIFKNGKIIIFDEPLAGLDKNTRKKAMKMIKENCSNQTVIIISHNQQVIPYVDRVVNINEINGV